MKVLFPLFEEATGAKIETSFISGDVGAKYSSIIASQDGTFDLIWAAAAQASLIDTLFADLTDKLEPGTVEDMAVTLSRDGRVYILPILDDLIITFYNKERFQAAGLPDKAPATWDEVYAACDALKKTYANDACFDWVLSYPAGTMAFWVVLVHAAGGRLWSDDFRQVAFNTPEGLLATQTLHDFMAVEKYGSPESYTVPNEIEAGVRFAQGLTSMTFNWTDVNPVFLQDATKSKVVGKVGAGIFPGIGTSKTGSIDGWEGYAVNKYSTNQDLAVALLQFLVSPENQRIFSDIVGFMPMRNSVTYGEGGRIDQTVGAEQRTYYYANWAAAPFTNKMMEVFEPTLVNLTKGSATPKDTLAKLAADAQTVIDEYFAN